MEETNMNFRKLRVMIPEKTFQEIKDRNLLSQIDALVARLLEEFLHDNDGDMNGRRKQY